MAPESLMYPQVTFGLWSCTDALWGPTFVAMFSQYWDIVCGTDLR